MNDEELVDTFVRYTNSMIGFLRDPYYQGFFFALKGMINSLLLGMDGAKIDRNIKVALLCSPIAARVLITGK